MKDRTPETAVMTKPGAIAQIRTRPPTGNDRWPTVEGQRPTVRNERCLDNVRMIYEARRQNSS